MVRCWLSCCCFKQQQDNLFPLLFQSLTHLDDHRQFCFLPGNENAHNNNNYSRPNGQNVDNFIGDRCSSRVLAPPGGKTSLSFNNIYSDSEVLHTRAPSSVDVGLFFTACLPACLHFPLPFSRMLIFLLPFPPPPPPPCLFLSHPACACSP